MVLNIIPVEWAAREPWIAKLFSGCLPFSLFFPSRWRQERNFDHVEWGSGIASFGIDGDVFKSLGSLQSTLFIQIISSRRENQMAMNTVWRRLRLRFTGPRPPQARHWAAGQREARHGVLRSLYSVAVSNA
jgi:hypothetical protein